MLGVTAANPTRSHFTNGGDPQLTTAHCGCSPTANGLASGRGRRGQSAPHLCPTTLGAGVSPAALPDSRPDAEPGGRREEPQRQHCFLFPFSYLHPMELLLRQSLRHGHVYLRCCCCCWLAQAKASGGDGAKEEEEEMLKTGRRSHSEEVSEHHYSSEIFAAATGNRAEAASEF